DLFATADGYMVLAVGNDAQFERFCQVIGRPELAADERFATNPARVKNRDVLIPILADVLRQKTTDEWLKPLAEAKVPAAPVWGLSQVLESDLPAIGACAGPWSTRLAGPWSWS